MRKGAKGFKVSSKIKIRSVLEVNALGLGDAWYLRLLRLSITSCFFTGSGWLDNYLAGWV